MKKNTIILIVVLAVVFILGISVISQYNGLVDAQENVNGKLATIDTQLQRRCDLIPNLINTVKGYTAYESSVIEKITDARANLNKATTPAEKSEANEELTTALSGLTLIVENYPDLKANDEYVQLMDELSGTENRIATARRDYNNAVQSYNASIKKFPKSILAGMFGFEKAEYFEASEKANEVPQVDFN